MSENYNFDEEIFKQEMSEMNEMEATPEISQEVLNEVKGQTEKLLRQNETEEERRFKNEVKQVKRFTEKIVKNIAQEIIF